MATTKTTQKNAWQPWHGVASELRPDTELSEGMLVLEYQAGGYEPIASVISINEAHELALDRMRRDYGKMPGDRFVLWARGAEGRMLKVPVRIAQS